MARNTFEEQIAQLAEDFAEAASLMLQVILTFLRGNASHDEAMGAIDETSDALKTVSASWARQELPAVYITGMTDVLRSPETPEVASDALSGDAHEGTLELFIEELIGTLAASTDRISEDAKGQIRNIGRQRLAASLDNGTNAVDEARRMEEELTQRGIKFTDKTGREWDTRAFAEMVLRTFTIEVSNEGNLNTAAELGSPGVRVLDSGPGDTCEPCRVANGQAWSLKASRANKTEHPNCRRAFSPLPSTFSGELDRS